MSSEMSREPYHSPKANRKNITGEMAPSKAARARPMAMPCSWAFVAATRNASIDARSRLNAATVRTASIDSSATAAVFAVCESESWVRLL
eukprot:1412884-Prymnesium_polylepis.1